MSLPVHPKARLSHLCLLPHFLPLVSQAPLSSLISAWVQIFRTGLDTRRQNKPVRSVPGSHQQLFGSHSGAYLAGGLYNHQTLRPVAAAPQDEVS